MPIRYTNNATGGGGSSGNPINGTETIGTDFGLGGELMQNTAIDAAGFEFDFYQNIGGLDVRQHIGPIFGGFLDGVGEYADDSGDDGMITFNGIINTEDPYAYLVSTLLPNYVSSIAVSAYEISLFNKQEGQYQTTLQNVSGAIIATAYNLVNNEDSAYHSVDSNGGIFGQFTKAAIYQGLGSDNIINGFAAYTDDYIGPEADSSQLYRYDTNIGLPVDLWGAFSIGIVGNHLWEIGNANNYRQNVFVALDESIRMFFGRTIINGVPSPPVSEVKCDTNGVHFVGAIHTGEVETVSATAIQATYTKRLAIYDLSDTLIGYVPLMNP